MKQVSSKWLGAVLMASSLSTLIPTYAAAPVKIGGLMQIDNANYLGDKGSDDANWDNSAQSGVDMRRLSLYAKGEIDKVWSYQLEWDAERENLGSSWIGFSGFEPIWVAVGRVAVPWGMETWASASASTFMEKSDALRPDEGIGLAITGSTSMGGFGIGVVSPDERVTDASLGEPLTNADKILWGGRMTFAPVAMEGNILHMGASYYRISLRNNEYRTVSNGPQVRARNNPIMVRADGYGTGDVKSQAVWSTEIAGEWGPLMAQAEYSMMHQAGRDNVGKADFKQWYAQASYVLTGESRAYDVASGTFGRVKPNANIGAWELALRYGSLDLSDRVTNTTATNWLRGELMDWTVGINWYANDNMKFQLNYALAKADYATATKDRDLNSIGLRAQVRF